MITGEFTVEEQNEMRDRIAHLTDDIRETYPDVGLLHPRLVLNEAFDALDEIYVADGDERSADLSEVVYDRLWSSMDSRSLDPVQTSWGKFKRFFQYMEGDGASFILRIERITGEIAMGREILYTPFTESSEVPSES